MQPITYILKQGRRKLFSGEGEGGGGQSKNVAHRGSPTTKTKKKYKLKHLKAVPQKTKPEPKYKWFKISHSEFF